MTTTNKKIGLSTAIIISINAMTGIGIFIIPSFLAINTGAAGLITFILAFISVFFIAKSLSRVTELYPQEGSFYNYSKQFGGHILGLFSAGAYLIGLLIAMGLLCRIAGDYLHASINSISSFNLGLASLLLLVCLNIIGLKMLKIGQYILILLTIIPLALITLLTFTKLNFSNFLNFFPNGYYNIFASIPVAIFSLFGFECTPSLFNILENPEKNLSKTIIYSISIVSLVYFLFILAIMCSVPFSIFTNNSNITITTALKIVFPEYSSLINCLNILISTAILGTIHSMIWCSSELFISFSKVSKLNFLNQAISKRKYISVLICSTILLISFLTIKNPAIFFDLTNIGLIFAFSTSLLCLLKIKKEWQSKNNFITLIALICSLIILIVALKSLFSHI